jgi:predicted phage terminase large subunit-like protein
VTRARAEQRASLARQAQPNPTSTEEFAERFRHFALETPWFHRLWYAAMDDPDIKRVFIMGPRLHAKTSTVLTYALRRLCASHQLRVGIISQTDALAKQFLAEIKHECQANEALLEAFGPSGGRPFEGDRWSQHQIVLADAREGPHGIAGKDVSIFAVGRGGQITGRHCDLLIVDDLETKESTDSDTVRQRTRAWWSREVEPVLAPGGKLIATGTRKHFDDIYAYWLAPDSGWTVVDQVKSVFLPDGSPIWPEMWSREALEARKRTMDQQDILAWSQEFLNEPRPSETTMFYPEKWPTYSKVPWGLTIFQYWDLAISERTTADYTVGWTIGLDEHNNVYLLERRRGHFGFNRTLAEIDDMGRAWPTVQAVGIEKVAYQAAAIQEALRRTMLPIIPDERTGGDKDKVTRARLLEARAAGGKVIRPVDAPWWSEFAAEALFFPAGAHDDQVDALSGAVRIGGTGATAISWQYGVWRCTSPTCDNLFTWEPSRPCPRCGTPAAATYENPEALGDSGIPQLHDHLPLDGSP